MPQSVDAATASRLGEIEARLARLEETLRQLSTQPRALVIEALDTADSIEKALRALGGAEQDRAQRIQLLERFLDLFPDDPRATAMLEALIAENLGTYPKLSLASLDRFGSRVVTDPLELDKLRANVLIQNHRFDDGRSYYERVLRAAPSAEVSADASFWIAYSYMSQANYAEARARFETLIAQHANDTSPGIVSLVSGAKNQLVLIEQYQAKKD
ncbi:MAG TPA: tetratricopeptide repeat protein [Planctomycetota bacterium]|nr:tetratricopeptide repeat protein [Planctomycetota bacterium]